MKSDCQEARSAGDCGGESRQALPAQRSAREADGMSSLKGCA